MSGRYKVPDPKCRHVRRGIVRAGHPSDVKVGFAATNVCDRQECIDDAMEWARTVARAEPQYVPDRPRP